MILLDETTFYATLGMVALISGCAGLFPMLLAKDLVIPYMKASLGKSKYFILEISKTNAIRVIPAEYHNGMAIIKNRIGRFVKLGLNGSYNIGNCRCDIVLNQVGIIAETEYVAMTEEMERLGIHSLQDMVMILNVLAANESNIPISAESYKFASEFLKAHPDYDFSVFYPLCGKMNIKKLVDWAQGSPEVISQAISEGIAEASEQYVQAASGKSAFDLKGMMPLIILGFVGILIAMMAMKGMGMV
ncbi:MAG: hypothetical protein O0X96_05750 [Methanocorpusculum sp.]|nr:hypothetical protein [Methanocorpusculum sp.]MDE2524615.1 hypothetical protein [Methanocorpusculum sp.]